jgi:DNA-binding transcriptional ArsR family regulator
MCVMDRVFKALADPTRRSLLDELSQRDGQTQYELCVRLLMKHGITISRQAVSKHLLVLEAVHLVAVERKGRLKLHYLTPAPLNELYRWVAPRAKTGPAK